LLYIYIFFLESRRIEEIW